MVEVEGVVASPVVVPNEEAEQEVSIVGELPAEADSRAAAATHRGVPAVSEHQDRPDRPGEPVPRTRGSASKA